LERNVPFGRRGGADVRLADTILGALPDCVALEIPFIAARSDCRAVVGHDKRRAATRAAAVVGNLAAVDRTDAAVGDDARAM
jgi:hypothetical protein